MEPDEQISANIRSQRLTVGVMGSATERVAEASRIAVKRLGRAVAQHQCVLITAATPGLPQAAVEGAREEGGLVIGISPALSRSEHIDHFDCPTEGFDVLIFSGSGLKGREIDTIRSADIVIIAGGRSGTLGEFSIAYDEGHLIGVLTGTGGISEKLTYILSMIAVKDTGASVIFERDPELLLERLIAEHDRKRVGKDREPALAGKAGRHDTPDEIQRRVEHEDEKVDEASFESFPASDPPGY